MDERKETEIKYYDKQAEEHLKIKSDDSRVDFEGFQPTWLSSFKYFYKLLAENCRNKKVLDYGCGNGVHTDSPMKAGASKVIGIDLSEKSLRLAREKIKKQDWQGKVEFLLMDCEKMTFEDDSFDVIMNGGTFSSLDIKIALPELVRVIKPQGKLIGIETFGHNPFTNLKRKLNEIMGKRTLWAESHIVRQESLALISDYFNEIKVEYFHLISWLAIPFLTLPGGKILLKILEVVDRIFLKMPFLRKYAFKIVFIFSKPKK